MVELQHSNRGTGERRENKFTSLFEEIEKMVMRGGKLTFL